MMHMTLYWGIKVTLLFDSWKTDSWFSYLLSLLACFLFSAFYQYLEDRRIRLKAIAVSNPPQQPQSVNVTLLTPKRRASSAKFATALLFGINSAIGYLLMLAVMSFNGGVFLAIVLGLTAGYLLFRSGDEERAEADLHDWTLANLKSHGGKSSSLNPSLLLRFSEKILHIDFGDCFEVKVPFLLPRMLVIAMEVISGTGGNFCFTFEDMMQVLSIVLWTMEVLIMKSIVPFCVSVLGFIFSSEWSTVNCCLLRFVIEVMVVHRSVVKGMTVELQNKPCTVVVQVWCEEENVDNASLSHTKMYRRPALMSSAADSSAEAP
ncbi:SOLUTE CARRIER FAMILY 31 COPPER TRANSPORTERS [Salix purpurea]|uniref:Copper transport protein n=1 Tax=Salix purpurea TaxID=77065 RepID=A0A9Q0Q2S9_SALPP|nr:SOLUTE CARRIER FAMILY 31 COPPER TRANSPORTERS [Salix purpurea]